MSSSRGCNLDSGGRNCRGQRRNEESALDADGDKDGVRKCKNRERERVALQLRSNAIMGGCLTQQFKGRYSCRALKSCSERTMEAFGSAAFTQSDNQRLNSRARRCSVERALFGASGVRGYVTAKAAQSDFRRAASYDYGM